MFNKKTIKLKSCTETVCGAKTAFQKLLYHSPLQPTPFCVQALIPSGLTWLTFTFTEVLG